MLAVALGMTTSTCGQVAEQRISGRDYKVYRLADYGIQGDSVHSVDMTTRLKALLSGKHDAAFVADSGTTYIFTYSAPDSLVIPAGCAWLQCGAAIRIYGRGQCKGLVIGGDDVLFDGGGGLVSIKQSAAITGHGEYGAAVAVGSYNNGTGYSRWTIRNGTFSTDKIDGDCIAVLGGCKDFLIENVHIPANSAMGRGVLLHWGGNSLVDTVAGPLVTKHPHDGSIRNVKVDSLGHSAGDGIYLSSTWNIKIDGAELKHCKRGVIVTPGDFGFFYQDTADTHIGFAYGQGISISHVAASYCEVGVEVSGFPNQVRLPASLDSIDIRQPVSIYDCNTVGDGTNNGYKFTHCEAASLFTSSATGHANGVYVGEGADSTTVSGCDLYDNTGYGIYLSSSIESPDMTSICRNRIWGNRMNSGIYLRYAQRVFIEHNLIGDSTENGFGKPSDQDYGIYVDGLDSAMRVYLAGNNIRDAQTRCAIRVNNLANIAWWCDNRSELDTLLVSHGSKIKPESLEASCLKGNKAGQRGSCK